MYQTNTKYNANEWITDPSVPDPLNKPIPSGWTIWVRPYPAKTKTTGGILLNDDTIDTANYRTNIGRVVSIGKSCWNRPEHRDSEGNRYEWCKVGDFIEWGSHIGKKRKFKGVGYIIINDDEILSVLPDPVVYKDDEGSGTIGINIPDEDLKKYNTIIPHYSNWI